jgi:hypothetical protein
MQMQEMKLINKYNNDMLELKVKTALDLNSFFCFFIQMCFFLDVVELILL